MSNLRIGTIVIIACAGVILLISFGVRSSYGVFLQPVSTDLGWSREIFALTIALQNLFWGFDHILFSIYSPIFHVFSLRPFETV